MQNLTSVLGNMAVETDWSIRRTIVLRFEKGKWGVAVLDDVVCEGRTGPPIMSVPWVESKNMTKHTCADAGRQSGLHGLSKADDLDALGRLALDSHRCALLERPSVSGESVRTSFRTKIKILAAACVQDNVSKPLAQASQNRRQMLHQGKE